MSEQSGVGWGEEKRRGRSPTCSCVLTTTVSIIFVCTHQEKQAALLLPYFFSTGENGEVEGGWKGGGGGRRKEGIVSSLFAVRTFVQVGSKYIIFISA